MYCYQHQIALSPALQERLRVAHGTMDWVPALGAAQAFAHNTIRWREEEVAGEIGKTLEERIAAIENQRREEDQLLLKSVMPEPPHR